MLCTKNLIIIVLIMNNYINCIDSLLQEMNFHRPFFKPGDLVYDIGANVGDKTKVYLAMGAHVIAVEPQPQCCKILHDKFNNHNVTIVQKGLASQPGKLTLFIASNYDKVSTFSYEWT